MPVIALINEEKGLRYDTEESVRNLIHYIFAVYKTAYDDIRPGHMIGDFLGCAPFFGTTGQQILDDLVSDQMIANNRAYGKTESNLIKHRVISFEESDFVVPDEAFCLARYVANAYGEDYITAYAVHLDTKKIHIHFVVNTIGWKEGIRFDKSFELKWLWGMVNSWEEIRDKRFTNNPRSWERNLRYYGTW